MKKRFTLMVVAKVSLTIVLMGVATLLTPATTETAGPVWARHLGANKIQTVADTVLLYDDFERSDAPALAPHGSKGTKTHPRSPLPA